MLGVQVVGLLVLALLLQRGFEQAESGWRQQAQRSQLALEAARIEQIGRQLERAAIDLAQLGVLLRPDSGVFADVDAARVEQLLRTHFESLPEALGGGLWYEPGAFAAGAERFGPYVFRDEEGQLQFTWDLSSDAYNYAGQPWYLAGLPRDWPRDKRRPRAVYWSDPYRDRAGSESLMLTAAAPLHDAQGRVLGLATVDWAIDALVEEVERMSASGGPQAFILDRRSGRLLAYSPDSGQVMRPVAGLAWAEPLLPQLRGDDRRVRARVEIAGIAHDLALQGTAVGLAVGLLTPLEDVAGSGPAALSRWLVPWLLITVSCGVLTAWILNRQVHALDALVTSLRQRQVRSGVDQAPLPARIADPGDGELQPLVEVLNGLLEDVRRDAQRLDTLHAELQAQQDAFAVRQASLEQRVNERTFELEANNAELQRTVGALSKLQEQLIEVEKQGSLGRLVAGIAHDINTPLGIAVTAASHLHDLISAQRETLARAAATAPGLRRLLEDGDEGFRMLRANLDRAAALVRSFKQISVDQSGEARRRFDLKAYLDELLLSLRPQFKRLPHDVVLECPRGLELDSYPGAWAQIVTNLLMNALRHGLGPERAGHIRILAEDLGDEVALTVSDDGKGIPAEQLPRVFEAFFTTASGQGGSGLGLAVVRDLVEQRLGGRIEAQSEPGQGASFTLRTPKVAPDAGA